MPFQIDAQVIQTWEVTELTDLIMSKSELDGSGMNNCSITYKQNIIQMA